MGTEHRLYYDSVLKNFSTAPTDNSIEVFKTHHREGLANGHDEIMCDLFKVVIQTNFYPKSPQRQYIIADIYINDVLLLPLSFAYRPNVKWWMYDLRENIYFTEYKRHCGKVDIYPKGPSTFVLLKDEINWAKLLSEICDICNHYKEWLSNEVELLVNSAMTLPQINWRTCSMLISMIRAYDKIAPDIIPLYHPVMDDMVLDAMTEFWENTKRRKVSNIEIKHLIEEGDLIWQYIKDYKLI